MSAPADLIQRLRAARRCHHQPKAAPRDVVPEGQQPQAPAPHPFYGGITFELRRPAEVELPAFSRFDPARVLEHITGWTGVTEEHLFGKGIGNTSAVDYSPELAADWLRNDQADLLAQIYGELLDAATQWMRQRDATAKN